MRPRTRLGGQKLFVFPTLKMWFGRFQKPKVVQNCVVFEKALPKRWRYRCFCLFLLVAMENVIIEFVGIYDVFMHVFSQNNVNTSVLRTGPKTLQNTLTISDM